MLARFERLMEDAVEGSFRRVFQTAIQPVQLAKAAARAMEEAQLIGVHGAEVPNSYRLRLAPADLERFADYRVTLARELNAYLVEYAHDRGLRPIAEPRVELVEDRGVRVGSVRAEARFVDLAPTLETEVELAGLRPGQHQRHVRRRPASFADSAARPRAQRSTASR